MKTTNLTFLLFLIIIIIGFETSITAQVQMGSNLVGENIGDIFGLPVSLSNDGERIAIGARRWDKKGENVGQVKMYEWNNDEWIQMDSFLKGNSTGEGFGWSVSLSSDGSRVAIGVPNNDDNGDTAGKVQVFDWINGEWVQAGIDIYGQPDDKSGWPVELSADGNRLAIGSPYYLNKSGKVRVYEWTNNTWVQIGADLTENLAYDYLGLTISLSDDGSRMALGIPYHFHNAPNTGKVQIFDWNGNEWIQVGMDIYGEQNGESCGLGISLSSNGSRVAIGSPGNNENGNSAGQVRVYELVNGQWNKIGNNINGKFGGDHLGYSASLSFDGNRIAVGAPFYQEGTGFKAGHVRLFELTDNEWIQIGLEINGEDLYDQCGWSVSLSDDGTKLATGSHGNNEGTGQVRVFDFSNTTRIESFSNNLIEIYPNPTDRVLNISDANFKSLELVDVLGKTVLILKSGTSQIDISYLPNGIYFIKVNFNNKEIIKRVIKN